MEQAELHRDQMLSVFYDIDMSLLDSWACMLYNTDYALAIIWQPFLTAS